MSTRGRLLVTLVALICVAGLVFAYTLVSTDGAEDDIAVTDAGPIEALIPPRDSEILAQASMGVDLRPGWTGVLALNGVEIPEDQLDLANVASLGQILFTPAEGRAVEEYDAGENCAAAITWRVEESRANARTTTWCFNVT